MNTRFDAREGGKEVPFLYQGRSNVSVMFCHELMVGLGSVLGLGLVMDIMLTSFWCIETSDGIGWNRRDHDQITISQLF